MGEVASPLSVAAILSKGNDCRERLGCEAMSMGQIHEPEGEEASKKGRSIGLSADVAHKLRGRLASIAHAAELLKCYGAELPLERREKYLDYILDGTKGFSRLIDDLAWYEKLNSGRLRATPGTYPLRSLLEDARQLLPEFDSDLRLKVEWGGPPVDVFLDGCMVAVALSKVLRNAWVYSPPAGEVNLVVQSEPGLVRVIVRDHGIGIPAGELSRIGEPFYRCSNVGEVAGSGMGLAIARACVVSLGGQIRIESEPKKGTVVQMNFPWAPSVAHPESFPKNSLA